MGSSVLIHRIKPEYMFGSDYVKIDGLFLPVSDLEKTLIDFFYFKEPLDGDVLKKLRKEIDKEKLLIYLKKYPKKFRESVLENL
jgi:predicted transcriptional regulator of viral defense system